MTRVVAINGSPRAERGSTALVLAAFVRGVEAAGAEVETVYPSRLEIGPCDCNTMRCWFAHPGECHHRDGMTALYPVLREAEVLVVATPVYVPLPGALQHVLNRFCPLMDPHTEWRDGRTRARLRDGVSIKKFVALVTGGWWERENCDTVVRIVREMAENAGVEFAGAVLRPHADVMSKDDGELSADGMAVLDAAETAGRELIAEGGMRAGTLEAVSRPLVPRDVFLRFWESRVSAHAH